jgi:polysaccharide pyruvyl transferase WcaK-like protein
VAALMAGRPVISLGYAAKNDELMQEVGLEAYCQHIERLDIERLKEQFKSMVEQRSELSRRLDVVIEGFRSSLAEQFDYCFHRS